MTATERADLLRHLGYVGGEAKRFELEVLGDMVTATAAKGTTPDADVHAETLGAASCIQALRQNLAQHARRVRGER